MKLQSVSVIFVLGVVGLARIANGLCLMRNTAEANFYKHHCFSSDNYLADVRSAPIDIPQLTFSISKIPVLRNRSFSRLNKSLEILEINFCETNEIEDKAFEGLVKLRSLDIGNNHLQIIKGAWFQGLSNLKTISFRNNEIKHIETTFYSIVPTLDTLDISANELTCFPMPSIAIFKTKVIHFHYNPMSWGCVAAVMDWIEKTGIEYKDFGRGRWDPSSEVVLYCEDKLGKSLDQLNDESVKKCAEEAVDEFLPSQENYTVDQVCKFLEGKPSPFLTCFTEGTERNGRTQRIPVTEW